MHSKGITCDILVADEKLTEYRDPDKKRRSDRKFKTESCYIAAPDDCPNFYFKFDFTNRHRKGKYVIKFHIDGVVVRRMRVKMKKHTELIVEHARFCGEDGVQKLGKFQFGPRIESDDEDDSEPEDDGINVGVITVTISRAKTQSFSFSDAQEPCLFGDLEEGVTCEDGEIANRVTADYQVAAPGEINKSKFVTGDRLATFKFKYLHLDQMKKVFAKRKYYIQPDIVNIPDSEAEIEESEDEQGVLKEDEENPSNIDEEASSNDDKKSKKTPTKPTFSGWIFGREGYKSIDRRHRERQLEQVDQDNIDSGLGLEERYEGEGDEGEASTGSSSKKRKVEELEDEEADPEPKVDWGDDEVIELDHIPEPPKKRKRLVTEEEKQARKKAKRFLWR